MDKSTFGLKQQHSTYMHTHQWFKCFNTDPVKPALSKVRKAQNTLLHICTADFFLNCLA